MFFFPFYLYLKDLYYVSSIKYTFSHLCFSHTSCCGSMDECNYVLQFRDALTSIHFNSLKFKPGAGTDIQSWKSGIMIFQGFLL